MVFGGGIAGVGYFGYQFYQNRFGPAPDFAGEGSGQVTVEIPKGAGGLAIARVLKENGVVKSIDAFVSAQQNNPNGNSIQAGAYVLRKGMSAASAVKLMLDPKSQNNVIVALGSATSLSIRRSTRSSTSRTAPPGRSPRRNTRPSDFPAGRTTART